MEVRDETDNRHMRLAMRLLLRPDDNCVDIGANVGSILREMVTVAPDGHHHAFEPIPDLAARLRSEFPTVDVHETALSDTIGTAEFLHFRGASALSGLDTQEQSDGRIATPIAVSVATLDSVIPPTYRPALIKIDVEGGEWRVLLGAERTLAAHHPVLIIEHYAGAAGVHGIGPEQLHPYLTSLGYRILDADGGGPYSLDEMRATFDARKLWTWFALAHHTVA